MTAENSPSPYRWVILALAWAASFVGVAPQFQVAALAYQVIPDLNLSMTQYSMAFAAPMLAAVLLSIPAGAIADKIGVKNVVTFGFIVATIGAYFRYAATSFVPFFILMFMTGVLPALLTTNISKLLGAWFPREQIGTAMGIFFTGAGVGMTVGLSTAAFFPTIKSAYTSAGYLVFFVAILWILFAKSYPANAPIPEVQPNTNYFSIVAKSKNVWLAGLALMLFMGANMVMSGNLANALQAVHGIAPATAGFMTSVVTIGNVFGSFLGPALSDRIGRIKPFLAPVGILSGIIMYLAWNSSGTLTWVLLAFLGFLMGVGMPLLISFPILLPEIGPIYAGSAGGLISTLQLLGAFFIPSFIVTPIAGDNFSLLFLLASGLFILYGLVTLLLPELGAKARR